MTTSALTLENISKRYLIGHKRDFRHDTFRDTLSQTFKETIHRIRHTFRPASGPRGNPHIEELWALQDVSCEIMPGERVGIIGRNGAGKTTLLKILSRITEPTRGRVSIRGRVASLLEVGTGFHPELTGRENIFLNGAILGMTKAEIKAKFDEIVAFAEIEKFLDTPVKRYSSGMYVRLAFAVAAHLEPEILLVDEVLAVGDIGFQKKCLGKMEDVAGEGRAILFVSHNLAAVQALCSRSILLETGTLVHDGVTEAVIERYVSSDHNAVEAADSHRLSDRRNAYLADGQPIIRQFKMLDSQGAPQDTFQMGREMKIVIDVQGLSDHRDAHIGVIFKSNTGQWIAAINSAMTCSCMPNPRRREEEAILVVPKIPFTPGSYWIDAVAAQQGIGRLDYVERAAHFHVVEHDVYGSGYLVSSHFGHIYLEGSWKIR